MAKVIVERPRTGRSWPTRPGRSRALVDDDGEPLGASAREPLGLPQKTRGLNENLNPLKRFLQSKVGRPWNKVFAEISENLKPTSTVQQHVRDHVEDFVAVKTRMRAGEVLVSGRWGRDMRLADSHQRLYVHPRTGLLRENPHWRSWSARQREARKRAAAARAERMREIDVNTQLHLFEGVWWEVKLSPIGNVRAKDKDGRVRLVQLLYEDVVHRAKLSSLSAEALYGRADAYASAKRPLSKQELKRYGLKP